MTEIYRVLKSGGLFINADKYAYDGEKEHTKHSQWQLQQFEIFDKINRPDLKNAWTKHYLDDEKPEIRMQEGEFREILNSLGFIEIEKIYRKHMEAVIVARRGRSA